MFSCLFTGMYLNSHSISTTLRHAWVTMFRYCLLLFKKFIFNIFNISLYHLKTFLCNNMIKEDLFFQLVQTLLFIENVELYILQKLFSN